MCWEGALRDPVIPSKGLSPPEGALRDPVVPSTGLSPPAMGALSCDMKLRCCERCSARRLSPVRRCLSSEVTETLVSRALS